MRVWRSMGLPFPAAPESPFHHLNRLKAFKPLGLPAEARVRLTNRGRRINTSTRRSGCYGYRSGGFCDLGSRGRFFYPRRALVPITPLLATSPDHRRMNLSDDQFLVAPPAAAAHFSQLDAREPAAGRNFGLSICRATALGYI